MTILDKIVERKKEEQQYQVIPSERMIEREKLSLFSSLVNTPLPLGIIAEIKKASPSKGVLIEKFNPTEIAKIYEELNVSGISVLTDRDFFQGRAEYLTEVATVVSVPLLRKDFIISEEDVLFSERIGADAILLIAAILEGKQLQEYHHQATELGLDILVEIHNETEAEKVLKSCNPKLLGVNNRNLNNFETDLNTTTKLRAYLPEGSLLISESGIHSKEDVDYLTKSNIHGLLIGEGFMKSANKKQFLDALFL